MSWFRLKERFTFLFYFFFPQLSSSLDLRTHNRAHNLFSLALFVLNSMKGLMLNKLKIQDCLWNKSFLICNVFCVQQNTFYKSQMIHIRTQHGSRRDNKKHAVWHNLFFFIFFPTTARTEMDFFVSWSRQQQLLAWLRRVCGLVTAPQVESLFTCTVENHLARLV